MRSKRTWHEGAMYHVVNRGTNRQNIFIDRQDRTQFLHILMMAKNKYGFNLHAYCLMGNHYHLLIETGTDSISRIMHFINQRYAMYFNKRHKRDGALFRDRFRSYEVSTESYFLQTSRYISLNPVKAGFVNVPAAYEWSSYRAMIGKTDDPLVTYHLTYSLFGKDAAIHYRKFVEETEPDLVMELTISNDIGEVLYDLQPKNE